MIGALNLIGAEGETLMHTTTCRVWRTLSLSAIIAITLSAASAQTETIVHTFTGDPDGALPSNGTLVSDANGNLFGTTESGGANGAGIVYELSPSSSGTWTEQILYSFTFLNNDGFDPYGGVKFDGKGNLYGTTAFGGAHSQGTVFELTPGSNGTWTETIAYSFPGDSSGGTPFAGIIIDSAGNIYGIAQGGTYGYGVLYELISSNNGTWIEKILHSFTGKDDGGVYFGESIILDAAGNIFGVAPNGRDDYGMVFEMVHGSNGSWSEKVLYSFTGLADGGGPYGGLVFDKAGNLYAGATFGVFELSPQSNGTWSQKLIYTFKGGSDGAYPDSPLIIDKAGNLYGTTNAGGSHRGTVYRLSLGSDGVWSEKILHRFAPNGVDGTSPYLAGLLFDASGNLYGTTQAGGTSNDGVVFKITF